MSFSILPRFNGVPAPITLQVQPKSSLSQGGLSTANLNQVAEDPLTIVRAGSEAVALDRGNGAPAVQCVEQISISGSITKEQTVTRQSTSPPSPGTVQQALTGRVFSHDKFFSLQPPAGLEPTVVQVHLSGIRPDDILDLAPDPPNKTLWLATRDGPKGSPTGVRLLGQGRDPLSLVATETGLKDRKVSRLAVRPGKYGGGTHLALIEGGDCSLHLTAQPQTVVRLASAIDMAFSRDGKHVAYGTHTGEVGVLKLSDSTSRGTHNVAVSRVVDAQRVQEPKATGWSFAFDASGELLFFVMATMNEGMAFRRTGWLDLKAKQKHLFDPPNTYSAADWAFAVGTAFSPQCADVVCFAGISKDCNIGRRKVQQTAIDPKPRVVQTRPESKWIRGVHLEDSTLAVLFTREAVWAIDPSHSTDERDSRVGEWPSNAPAVGAYHYLGHFSNDRRTRNLFVVTSEPVRAAKEDDCGGRDPRDTGKR